MGWAEGHPRTTDGTPVPPHPYLPWIQMPAKCGQKTREVASQEKRSVLNARLPQSAETTAAQPSVMSLQYSPLNRLNAADPGPIWRQCEERVWAPSEAPLGQRPCQRATGTPRGSMDRSGDSHTPGLGAAARSMAVTVHSRAGSASCGDRRVRDLSLSSAADALAPGGPRGSRFPHL